jgi:hypothetical protein
MITSDTVQVFVNDVVNRTENYTVGWGAKDFAVVFNMFISGSFPCDGATITTYKFEEEDA